jgi:hypothetical protein
MTSIGRIAAPLALLLAAACAQQQSPTPDDVSARFHSLRDSLDADFPGEAIHSLEAFVDENARYQVADSARAETLRFRSMLDGRYHEARELAREGEFDAAEFMLRDLALLPDTEDGASAARHLEFEFHFEKAKWLLVRQRFEESEAVARALLTRDLNRFQRDQVEQILDYSANVDGAMAMSRRANAEGACRQLVVFLANLYVNDGHYPSSLSLADLENLDPYASRTIADALESIEDYRATPDTYSLVAVSKDGHRFRIENGKIEQ